MPNARGIKGAGRAYGCPTSATLYFSNSSLWLASRESCQAVDLLGRLSEGIGSFLFMIIDVQQLSHYLKSEICSINYSGGATAVWLFLYAIILGTAFSRSFELSYFISLLLPLAIRIRSDNFALTSEGLRKSSLGSVFLNLESRLSRPNAWDQRLQRAYRFVQSYRYAFSPTTSFDPFQPYILEGTIISPASQLFLMRPVGGGNYGSRRVRMSEDQGKKEEEKKTFREMRDLG